ncbi:hypothetical protein D3C85_1598850 [compost metagenome]
MTTLPFHAPASTRIRGGCAESPALARRRYGSLRFGPLRSNFEPLQPFALHGGFQVDAGVVAIDEQHAEHVGGFVGQGFGVGLASRAA